MCKRNVVVSEIVFCGHASCDYPAEFSVAKVDDAHVSPRCAAHREDDVSPNDVRRGLAIAAARVAEREMGSSTRDALEAARETYGALQLEALGLGVTFADIDQIESRARNAEMCSRLNDSNS